MTKWPNSIRIVKKEPWNSEEAQIKIVAKKTEAQNINTKAELLIIEKPRPEIRIIKKEPNNQPNNQQDHSESASHTVTVDWKSFEFFYQKTPANCGPLSLVNALHALSVYYDFLYPEDFPKTSRAVRDMLVQDASLRQTSRWPYWTDVWNDNHALDGEIVSNFIKKVASLTNLEIEWDRLWQNAIPTDEVEDTVDRSDRIIVASDFHYVSYTRIDSDNRLKLDSLFPPCKVSDTDFKEIITREAIPFTAIKVRKKI